MHEADRSNSHVEVNAGSLLPCSPAQQLSLAVKLSSQKPTCNEAVERIVAARL